jgi:hypothetical protein
VVATDFEAQWSALRLQDCQSASYKMVAIHVVPSMIDGTAGCFQTITVQFVDADCDIAGCQAAPCHGSGWGVYRVEAVLQLYYINVPRDRRDDAMKIAEAWVVLTLIQVTSLVYSSSSGNNDSVM